ncbi:MAG: TauD/TfdA family dioxygenase [Gammaproteobacteria bacterium]|nr:TauD/TfdA family dioxygenase [Gammaproteobacteria bacterium]
MSKPIIETVSVADQQDHGAVFPLAYALQTKQSTLSDMHEWIQSRRDQLLEQLAQHGAILFRGFPIKDAEDFDSVIRTFRLDSFTYQESLSNAVRVNRTELVFTANEAPPEVSIFLHHEMAQTPLFPSRLFFCCETAPESDGETPICRSDVLLDRLQEREPDFVAACENLGVRYSNVMPAQDDPESGQGRSWKSTLDAADTAEAEMRLDKLGYAYEWLPDNTLRVTTPVLPAIRTLVGGRRVFFNQLIAAFRGWQDVRNDPRKSICFGDDSEIPTDSMNVAIELADELSFNLAWQDGDVALIDNYLVMHGRRPFKGKRRVLASLVADDGSRLAA